MSGRQPIRSVVISCSRRVSGSKRISLRIEGRTGVTSGTGRRPLRKGTTVALMSHSGNIALAHSSTQNYTGMGKTKSAVLFGKTLNLYSALDYLNRVTGEAGIACTMHKPTEFLLGLPTIELAAQGGVSTHGVAQSFPSKSPVGYQFKLAQESARFSRERLGGRPSPDRTGESDGY